MQDKVLPELKQQLAEWERKVKESRRPTEKERYAPPERKSIRDQPRRLQAEGKQKPKHDPTTEKDSFHTENNTAGHSPLPCGITYI